MNKLTDDQITTRTNKDAEKVKKVMTRYGELATLRQGPEKVWEEDDRQYNNLIEERTYQGNADIKVPATYDAVETLVSFTMDALYSRPMPVEKVGAEGGDVEKVKLYNRKAQIHMNNMPNRRPFRDRNEEVVRRGFVQGVSVVKTPYDGAQKGAAYIPVPNEELYYDYLVGQPYMLDFITHRLRRSHSNLLKNKDKYNKGYNITKAKLKPLQADEKDTVEGNTYRHILDSFKIGNKNESRKGYCDLYETHFLHDWEGKGELVWTIATIINKKHLIRFEKAEYEFPPFLFWIINKQEGTLLGKSIPRLVRPAQIELNDYRSQMLDAGTTALQQMYTIDELADIDPYQLRNRPNGYVGTQGPGGVEPIKRDLSFLAVGQTMQATLVNDIQVLSGATSSLTDALEKGSTAFASRKNLANSTRRVLSLYVKKYVDNILSTWLDLDFKYTVDHVPYEDFMRMVGKEAGREGEEQLKDYFDVEMDTMALGFDEVTDKVVKIQEAMNALGIVAGMPNIFNVAEWAKDLAEAMGKKNVEKYVFLPPPSTLMNAEDENANLLMGHRIDPPHPKDNHGAHKQKHSELQDLPDGQAAVRDEHNAMHDQMGAQAQGGRPTQELPNIDQGQQLQPEGIQESQLNAQASVPQRRF